MEALRIALLVYAGVLVVALAVGLILILVRLRGAASGLERTMNALVKVGDRTEPLEPHLRRLLEAVESCREGVTTAGERIEKSVERVDEAAEPSGAVERTHG